MSGNSEKFKRWKKLMGQHRGFNVYLGKKWIDTVFYTVSPEETIKEAVETVRRSLVEHDGYDPYIRVSLQRIVQTKRKLWRPNPQSREVRGVATGIRQEGGWMVVRYHGTPVVRFNTTVGRASLQSGGWMSATTKLRMNQTANEYHMPFQVFQKGGSWFVKTPNATYPYKDGMELNWNADDVTRVTERTFPLEI